MKRILWQLSALAAFLASSAFGAHAAAQTLMQTSAAGACTHASPSAPYDGGFILSSSATSGASFHCAIGLGAIDIDDIESAEAFVVDLSSTSNAWARLCVRSIADGSKTCGASVYSAGNGSQTQTLAPQMPGGNFDDDDSLPYLEVYVPKPSNPGYAYFWGLRVLAD
jgi:hypothetical protein